MNDLQDDRIFQATRVISGLVVPFLVLAFLILFFFPEQSGQRFAWDIKPPIMAVFMGAGYLGGSWLFIHAVFGRRWHRVAPGYLPVTTFTIAMLLATFIHWDRFDKQHFPFLLWLILYLATPFLVPWMWFRNRRVNSVQPEPGDLRVPVFARMGLGALGTFLVLFALSGFIFPNWLAGLWPWKLTLLTARVLSGWLALLGVGGLVISRESRWSSWKIGLECIMIWHVLVIVGAALHPADFQNGLVNWYLASVLLVVLGMMILYILMEIQRRSQPMDQAILKR